MYTVTGSKIHRELGELRAVHLGEFRAKQDAIAFAREAVNRPNIGHTSVCGPTTVVREFFRYTLTDDERAGRVTA